MGFRVEGLGWFRVAGLGNRIFSGMTVALNGCVKTLPTTNFKSSGMALTLCFGTVLVGPWGELGFASCRKLLSCPRP